MTVRKAAGDATILHQRGSSSADISASRQNGWNFEDVRAFQVHLVSTGVSWPGLNQIVCALRFFYGVTLGESEIPERIPYAREPRKLPVVLSADEVVRFLESVSSLKSRAALTTAYAAGLRASEVAGLRVEDIDSTRGRGSRSAMAAVARTAARCCRPTCSASCVLIGGSRGQRPIRFPDAMTSARSTRPFCTPPAGRRSKPQA